MAIDFPNSPTNGETFTSGNRSWTFNGTRWEAVFYQGAPGPTGPAGLYKTQATAPSAPNTGDAWMNTTDGRLYVWNGYSWFEPTNNQAGPPGPSGSPTGPTGANGIDGIDGVSPSLTKTVVDKSANYSLTVNDKNQAIRFTGSSDQTLTVDNVLDVGSSTSVFQDGTGTVKFVAGSGVTLLSPGIFSTRTQYSKVDVNCVASGQYRLSGDVSTAPTVTGGTLTSDSTYYYRTFTSSGSLVISGGNVTADILVVAGGGAGGAGTGGGGGAGGLINISSYPLSASTYTVTVGAGGTNDDIDLGTSGVNTVVTNSTRTLTALGGGYGGATETNNYTYAAASGGSGGGGQGYYSGNNSPGSATQPSTTNDGVATYANTGFGNAGGSPSATTSGNSGGGGGAGAAGANGSSGAGGAGLQLSISGTSQWYAAGGGGGQNGTTSTNGIGGYHVVPSGTAGATNTGSGGGGGYAHAGGYGGNGGSGIVIVRYLKTAVA